MRDSSEGAATAPSDAPTRRHVVRGFTAATVVALSRPALSQDADAAARTAIAGAATAVLTALPADGRRRSVFAFYHPERRNWGYVPRGREGVAFKDMPPAARDAAHELMKSSLSATGYAKAENVIRLEDVLRQ